MTPTVNTSPLAALLTDSTPTQSGDISSLAAAPGASQGENKTGGESKFFNILQLVGVESSSESGLTPLTVTPAAIVPGQAALSMGQTQPPGILTGPLLTAEQSLGESELPLALTDPPAGQAQFLSAHAMRKEFLESGSTLVSTEEVDIDQLLTPETSPVSSLPAVPLSAQGLSGSQSPPGGNGLPGLAGQAQMKDLAGQAHMMRRNLTDGAGRVQAVPMGTVATADEGLAALSLPKELPAPVLAPAHFERMPVPEFAGPLAKILGSQVGSPNSPSLTSANVDVSALLSEGEINQAELTRSATTVSPLDRPSAVQQTVTTLTLPRPAGAPGWDQGLGQRILWMVENGLNQAELRLDPPNLGSVSIRIAMVDDQAQLQFNAANPAAREALESALPKLREMFNQEGLELGDADVSDEQTQSEGEGDLDSDHLQAQLDADSQKDADSALTDWSQTEHRNSSLTGNNGSNVLIDEFV